jgi:hypothetical protein
MEDLKKEEERRKDGKKKKKKFPTYCDTCSVADILAFSVCKNLTARS